MRAVTTGVVAAVLGLLILVGWGIASRGSTVPAEPAALRTGQLASDFSIELFSGDAFSLVEQRGKAVVVNFWGSWCPPCRQEAPVLEQAWRAYGDRGVVLIGVDVWDNAADARSFLQEFDITYPNGPDPNGEIAIAYGLMGVPETWFIDREGRLVRRWVGPLTDQQVSALIEEALR